MPEARGKLPKGCRMFQRTRDLSAPLISLSALTSALISSGGAKATTVARVHVTCELSGEGGLAAPLSLTRFGCAGAVVLLEEIWFIGRACACLLAAIDAAVRWTTANGAWACDDADVIPFNSMLSSTVVINDYDYDYYS